MAHAAAAYCHTFSSFRFYDAAASDERQALEGIQALARTESKPQPKSQDAVPIFSKTPHRAKRGQIMLMSA